MGGALLAAGADAGVAAGAGPGLTTVDAVGASPTAGNSGSAATGIVSEPEGTADTAARPARPLAPARLETAPRLAITRPRPTDNNCGD